MFEEILFTQSQNFLLEFLEHIWKFFSLSFGYEQVHSHDKHTFARAQIKTDSCVPSENKTVSFYYYFFIMQIHYPTHSHIRKYSFSFFFFFKCIYYFYLSYFPPTYYPSDYHSYKSTIASSSLPPPIHRYAPPPALTFLPLYLYQNYCDLYNRNNSS